MSDPMSEAGRVSERTETTRHVSSFSRGIDWSDPNVPAGNAPPLARWPLVLAACAWLAWIIFLAILALTRQAPPAA